MDMTGVAPMTERLTMGSYRLPIGVDTSRLFIKIEELHEVCELSLRTERFWKTTCIVEKAAYGTILEDDVYCREESDQGAAKDSMCAQDS
jgi:hypothetical protein